MNNLYDVLEVCLQELENGMDVDAVVARYPDLAGELRPILVASVEARSMAVLEPSPEIVRRGRAKLLQRASEMREAKLAPRSKRVIPFFQRIAISFTLTSLFLASGTGLVGASSNALPGENLYPVKLTWENVRLFFTFDHATYELLEHAFENERLHEVNELITEGKHATIRFSGVYTELNGKLYVAGIRLMLTDTSILPAIGLVNGDAVNVTGHTNAAGFVDVEVIELLPAGTVVPTGEPINIEADHNGNINDGGGVNENVNTNGNENGDDNNANINDNGGNENEANGNDNANVNDNGNDNGGSENNNNDDEDNNDGGGGNDNGSGGGDNSNENSNENSNDNTNDNANDNSGGGNDNSGGNDNGGGGGNDNSGGNDNGGGSNDNSNDNVNDGNTNDDNSNDDVNSNDDNSNDDNSNSDDNNNNGGKIMDAVARRLDRLFFQ